MGKKHILVVVQGLTEEDREDIYESINNVVVNLFLFSFWLWRDLVCLQIRPESEFIEISTVRSSMNSVPEWLAKIPSGATTWNKIT